jgi:hypothetical protein
LNNNDNGDLYWIGLTDLKEEGKFVWTISGSTPKYNNWESGEPNGGWMEDCVNLNHASQSRTWNDLSCDKSGLFALCERG